MSPASTSTTSPEASATTKNMGVGGITAILRAVSQQGLAAWLLFIVLIGWLTIKNPAGLWSTASLASVLTATVVLGLVALGQHLVVLTGGIDLSVGSVATLGALLTAVLINGYPIRTVPVIVAVLVLGAFIGVAHGLMVARLGLAPFIVTLASFYAVQGLALVVSPTPTGQMTAALNDFAIARTGPIPHLLVVLILAALLIVLILNHTALGRHVFAVGGDSDAARANGIPVTRTIVFAYAASGVLAITAGILLAARATLGSATAGQGLELSAIAAVVIGGVSLLGGRGTVLGTLGGVALLTLISSSITILQLPPTITDLVRGTIIVLAAALFISRKR